MHGIMRRSKFNLSDNPPRCPTTRSKIGAKSRDGVVLRALGNWDSESTELTKRVLYDAWTGLLEEKRRRSLPEHYRLSPRAEAQPEGEVPAREQSDAFSFGQETGGGDDWGSSLKGASGDEAAVNGWPTLTPVICKLCLNSHP